MPRVRHEETNEMKPIVFLLGAIPAAAGVMLMSAIPIQAQNAQRNAPQTQNQVQAPQGALCGNRDEIVRSLTEQFKESPQAVGVIDQNAVLEIFVSAAGTWTIIETGTDGNSCLVSSGEGWDSKTMVAGFDA
jgi:hypothetical protein